MPPAPRRRGTQHRAGRRSSFAAPVLSAVGKYAGSSVGVVPDSWANLAEYRSSTVSFQCRTRADIAYRSSSSVCCIRSDRDYFAETGGDRPPRLTPQIYPNFGYIVQCGSKTAIYGDDDGSTEISNKKLRITKLAIASLPTDLCPCLLCNSILSYGLG